MESGKPRPRAQPMYGYLDQNENIMGPANATLDGVNGEVIRQASTQLGELLSELKAIEVGRTTLRCILVGAPATPLESPLW